MFSDARSKSVVFVAHCILNQNAVSDGTASTSGCIKEILELLSSSDVGVVQMPCPELHCLGLDRGNVDGSSYPVTEENTRIRKMLGQSDSTKTIKRLAQHVSLQVTEYLKHGFEIKGIVGINRSPSCGVDTTSKDNQEMDGKGVFVEALCNELDEYDIRIDVVGIKAFETNKAIVTVGQLLGLK